MAILKRLETSQCKTKMLDKNAIIDVILNT